MDNKPLNIKDRKDVWIALSDLFLDTDVSLNYDYISRVCAASEYSLEELKKILENEVAPVCYINLLIVAGEWVGFDEEWLVNKISKRIRKQKSILHLIFKPLRKYGFNQYLKGHWQKLEIDIIEKRKVLN